MPGGVPAYPASEDYLAKLSGWQMLGNDVAGDCNAVTWANLRRLVTATLTTEYYPTQAQVWQFYQTQNPGFDPNGTKDTNGPGSNDDQGMDIQTGLEYLHTAGGPDGVKAVAFAKVDHTNMAEVKAALAIFGGLWLGIQVLDANQQQFAEGKAWTDVAGSPIDGGHAILGGGYGTDIKFITWAKETRVRPVVLERRRPGRPACRGGLGRHLARAPRHQGFRAGRGPGPAGRRLPGPDRQRADAAAVRGPGPAFSRPAHPVPGPARGLSG